MNYFQIGDTLDYSKYNGLVYLLRKSKRLRTNITLGEKNIVDKYGTYRFIGDFTNINGNYILEEAVNIYADDVFKNAVYTFVFNVINIDTSEEINRRIIYKEGDTGDAGVLNITLPDDMLEENEVIIPSVIVDIYFSTHEYQNNLNSFKVSLDVEETYLTSGTNEITLTILEPDDTPLSNVLTTIYINNTPHQVTTDNNGEATYNYQYTGTEGKVTVRSNGATAVFFDGVIDFGYNRITGSPGGYSWALQLGWNSQNKESWLPSNGEVTLYCPIGSNQWSLNNPKTPETFRDRTTSQASLTEVSYKILGDVTAIGPDMFDYCGGLTYINIPKGIRSIGQRAFYYTTDLKSITIPDTVYTLGHSCFYGSGIEEITLPRTINNIRPSAFGKCKIKTYNLLWTGNEIIPYNVNTFPVIDETVFKIPFGETANYVAKNYPADRLEEVDIYELTLETTTPIIGSGGTASALATLMMNGEPAVGEDIEYVIKHGSTVISTGTATTDSDGEATISYTGTGAGDIQITVTYDDLTRTVAIEDCYFYDALTTDNSLFDITSGSATLAYSSNGLKMTGTANNDSIGLLSKQLPSGDYTIEFDVTDATGDTVGTYSTAICAEDTMMLQNYGDGIYARKISTSGDFFDSHAHFGSSTHMKLVVTGSSSKTIKYYKDGTLLGQGTSITQNREFKFRSYNNRMVQIKNLKITED